LRERVENLTIPVTVIRCDYSKPNHMEFLFTTFHRLNKGGVTLNNQEIRNCIYSGQFNDLLKKLDEEVESWQLIKAKIAGSTGRFKSIELLLRFLAFYDRLESYSGSLPKFLNSFMQTYREGQMPDLERFENIVRSTSDVCAARILENLTNRVGYAAWEAILVGSAKNLENLSSASNAEIAERVRRFVEGPELSQDSLRGAISGTEKVKNRIGAAIRAFA
jgi:hypothetical protein